MWTDMLEDLSILSVPCKMESAAYPKIVLKFSSLLQPYSIIRQRNIIKVYAQSLWRNTKI